MSRLSELMKKQNKTGGAADSSGSAASGTRSLSQLMGVSNQIGKADAIRQLNVYRQSAAEKRYNDAKTEAWLAQKRLEEARKKLPDDNSLAYQMQRDRAASYSASQPLKPTLDDNSLAFGMLKDRAEAEEKRQSLPLSQQMKVVMADPNLNGNVSVAAKAIAGTPAQDAYNDYLKQLTDYSAYTKAADFEKYSKQGAAIKNPTFEDAQGAVNIFGWRPGAENIGNIVTFSRDNIDKINGRKDDDDKSAVVGNPLYSYMRDEEVSIYNYLLAKEGQESAQRYLDSIEQDLNQRYGHEVAKTVENTKGTILNPVMTAGVATSAGLDQWGGGVKQAFNEYKQPTSAIQYAGQEVREQQGALGKLAYDAVNTLSNMAPSILASYVAMGLGAPAKVAEWIAAGSLGLGSGGNAYKQALEEGRSKEEAKVVATLTGASEATLSKLLSGIGAYGGLTSEKLLPKVAAIEKAIWRVAAAAGVKLGGEIAEEELQLFLEPLFKTVVYGDKYDTPAVEDVVYTALLTALTTGLLEGSSIAKYRTQDGAYAEAGIEPHERTQSTKPVTGAEMGKNDSNAQAVAVKSAQEQAIDATIREAQEKNAAKTAEDAKTEKKQNAVIDALFGRNKKTVSESNTEEKVDDTTVVQMQKDIEDAYASGEMSDEEYDSALEALMEEESRVGVTTLDRYNPVMMKKAEENDNARSSVSDGSGQRVASESAGKQTGELAESTGRDQSGTVQSVRARDRADAVARIYEEEQKQPVTGRSYLQSSYVEDAGQIYDIPQSVIDSDEELSRIESEASGMGMTVHFFTGEAKLVNGRNADAMIRGNDVYIRADSDKWTATQNWEHEKFHRIVSAAKSVVQDLFTQFTKKTDAAKLHRTMAVYRDAYHGICDTDQNGNYIWDEDAMYRVVEEILADAYAGKDTFAQGVEQYADATRDAASQIEEQGVESRGPPEGNFSAAGVNAKTADLDALNKAEEMERRGVDEDIIYRDTGWYRGKDQKWRFEIDDSGMEYNRSGDAYFRRRYPEYNEFRELGVRQLYEWGTESWTEQDQDRLLQLNEIWRNEPGRLSKILSDGNATLRDILEHSALFEAYPELEDVKVRFGELDAGEKGHYSRSRDEIVLSDSLKKAPEDTLLHEIQHAIQKIEGFSFGASPFYWAVQDEKTRVVKQELRAQRREIMDSMSKDDLNKYSRYKELMRELERLETAEDGTPEGDQYLRYDRESDQLYLELYNTDWFKQLDSIEHQLNGGMKQAYERFYRNTAGEIEARETARRRTMTADQRRESIPYRGDENTVFADGAEISASIKRTSQMTLAEQLKQYYDGKMPTGDAFYFGETPDILSRSGFERLPLAMTISNFKKSTREKHNVPRRVLKAIESKLEKPLFSFGADGKVAVVIDDIDGNGNRMLVAIHSNKTMDREPINEITSMYGIEHPAEWINNQIKDRKEFVLYNEERTNTYLQTYGYWASMGEGIRSMEDTVPQERHSVKGTEKLSASGGDDNSVTETEQDPIHALPKKAQRIIEGEESKLTNALGNALRIPFKSRGEQLQGIAREITNEFMQTGDVSERTLEDLFEKAYRPNEQKLAEEFGVDVDEYRDTIERDFKAQVGNLIAQIRLANRYAADQENGGSAAGKPVPTLEELPQLYADMKAARRTADKAVARNLLTESDNAKVNRLLRGDIDESMLNPLTDNVNGILEVYKAKAEYEKFSREIRRWNAQRKDNLRQLADKLLETAGEWKDKSDGWKYSRETMERNIRDIVKDKKLAEEVISTLFTPVHKSAAKATAMKNEYRDRVRALNLSRNVAKGNDISEAAAVQLLGEAEDNIRYLQKNKFMKERDGKTLEDWQGIVRDLWEKNPNLDAAKIRKGVNEFRAIYDELFEQMNEARMRNGYEPINYRKGYFPHFQSEHGDGILAQFGKSLGINIAATQLPTTINGMTHTFKPGIQWFGSAQQRQGVNTSFDAIEGFDAYIEGVADVIHQTDNIQRLRAFATQVRYRTSDEGLRKQVDQIRNDPRLTDAEKQNEIDKKWEEGKFELGNFAVELDEYTNLLAGKKSRHDRNMEQLFNRKAYAIMKAVEGRVAANMVAVNPGSWLTNFIPITQGWATLDSASLLSGMWDTLRAIKQDDGMVASSSFLTNRRGSDPLVKTWAQEASAVLSKPMELIDSFTADSLVRGRYKQNIKRGMSEAAAIEEADTWAAGVMADRSKGATPTMFSQTNPFTKLFTQFQLEVNNQLSYVFKDIPRETREKGVAALAMAMLKFMIGAYLYDEIYEYFIGRRPALDPLGIINDTVGDLTGYELGNLLNDGLEVVEVEKKGLFDAGVNFGKAVAEELPFVGSLLGGGRLPISSAFPDVIKIWQAASENDWDARKRINTAAKELAKPVAYLAPPFGGGQIKKAAEGLEAVIRGGSYNVDNSGADLLQYPVANDTFGQAGMNAVMATLFGKSSLPAAREWVESGFDSLTDKQTALFESLRNNGAGTQEAFDLIRDLETLDTKLDKMVEIGETHFDETLKELAMSNQMSFPQYEKYMAARAAGVTTEQYTKLLKAISEEAKAQKVNRQDGKPTTSEIETEMWGADLTPDERRALWDNKGKPTKNYDELLKKYENETEIGAGSVSQKVLEAVLKDSKLTRAQKRAIWNSYGWSSKSPW